MTHPDSTPGGEFREGFQNPKADPLDAHTCEFDWAGLEAALGEAREECPDEERYEQLVAGLRVILRWLADGMTTRNPDPARQIGRRAVALLWAIDPGYFAGSPSLSRLAKRMKLCTTTLSEHSAAAHRDFGVCNRGQKHGWNWKGAKP